MPTLEQLERQKTGSTPYRNRSGEWVVPTNDPATGYVQMWQSNGTLLWVPQSSIDHGSLGGLLDDDHTQYALLAGRSGGQSLSGGTATLNKLSLRGNTTGDGAIEIYTPATGATGATLELYHDSTSPAVNDVPGELAVYAEDANGTKTLVARWLTVIGETTAGAMSSYVELIALDDGVARGLIFAPDQNSMYPTDDAHGDLGIASTNRFRSGYFSGVLDFGTGLRQAGAATANALLVGNGTNFVSDITAWTTYTPTITAGTGTFTTVSGAGRYKQLGKTLHISVIVTITTNGTAATSVIVPLPAGMTAAGGFVLNGRGALVSGKQLQGLINGATSITVFNYDNTYPGATGEGLIISGTIEIT